MKRINLYSYRSQEVRYKKLRIYMLVICASAIAIIINIIIYMYFSLAIIKQESRNNFLQKHVTRLNKRLEPVRAFEARIKDINQQIALIYRIEDRRDDVLAVLQTINHITPPQIYFSDITLMSGNIIFTGVTASPLYLAALLDRIKLESSIFETRTSLRSNRAIDADSYNFVISAHIKTAMVAKSNG